MIVNSISTKRNRIGCQSIIPFQSLRDACAYLDKSELQEFSNSADRLVHLAKGAVRGIPVRSETWASPNQVTSRLSQIFERTLSDLMALGDDSFLQSVKRIRNLP